MSRVRDSGSTFTLLLIQPTMASDLAQDTVVPNINGTDESQPLPPAESKPDVVNSEATSALVNG